MPITRNLDGALPDHYSVPHIYEFSTKPSDATGHTAENTGEKHFSMLVQAHAACHYLSICSRWSMCSLLEINNVAATIVTAMFDVVARNRLERRVHNHQDC